MMMTLTWHVIQIMMVLMINRGPLHRLRKYWALDSISNFNLKNKRMGLLSEFRTFATKGNVMDLAIGVVIGTAFAAIVGSLVSDIIMPLINPLMPAGGWRTLVVGDNIMIG